MRLSQMAAVLAISTVVTLGMAQTNQGTGNQRGTGSSTDNSSNGGAGTNNSGTATKKHHKSHKHAAATTQDGETSAPAANTNPGDTPSTGKAANGSTPPQQ